MGCRIIIKYQINKSVKDIGSGSPDDLVPIIIKIDIIKLSLVVPFLHFKMRIIKKQEVKA